LENKRDQEHSLFSLLFLLVYFLSMKLGAFTLFFVAITIVSSQAPVAKDAGVAINLPGFGVSAQQ
jgi:uncharacterized membrane protein (DUF485 family)